MVDTFAIFSFLKYEHSYINQFIEHHLNLGFTYFYLIVDNLDKNNIQEDYNLVIKDEFKEYVKLYDVRNRLVKNGDIHSNLITYFNKIILPEIKEDWVLTIGCDSFIYLDGMAINDYIKKINETDISQILFPHFFCLNLHDKDVGNLINNTGNMCTTLDAILCCTLGRVNNIKQLYTNSHWFISKTNKQKIYFSNLTNSQRPKEEKYIITDNINLHELFNNVGIINILDKNCSKFFIIHFFLRCIDEVLIKDLLYWGDSSVVAIKKVKIRNLILTLKNNDYNGDFVKKWQGEMGAINSRIKILYSYKTTDLSFINDIDELEKHNYNVDVLENKKIKITSLNEYKYNTILIKNILKELNITNEQYVSFKNILCKKL